MQRQARKAQGTTFIRLLIPYYYYYILALPLQFTKTQKRVKIDGGLAALLYACISLFFSYLFCGRNKREEVHARIVVAVSIFVRRERKLVERGSFL